MLIYHASYTRVERPDTQHSRQNLDFGKGFYATVMVYFEKPQRHTKCL